MAHREDLVILIGCRYFSEKDTVLRIPDLPAQKTVLKINAILLSAFLSPLQRFASIL
jgi:hypothetical protein